MAWSCSVIEERVKGVKGKQGKGETEVKVPFLGLLVGNEIKGKDRYSRDLASGADLPKIVYKARS